MKNRQNRHRAIALLQNEQIAGRGITLTGGGTDRQWPAFIETSVKIDTAFRIQLHKNLLPFKEFNKME